MVCVAEQSCPELRTKSESCPPLDHKPYPSQMKTRFQLAIRCGTPDCDWGFPMPNLGELALKCCYSAFQQHCVEVHGLREGDEEAFMHLDLEKWTLTLLK